MQGMSAPMDETREPVPNAWPDLSQEEREELRRELAEARAELEDGVPGIPMEEVLPRYRKAG